jgi:hypothetical protein
MRRRRPPPPPLAFALLGVACVLVVARGAAADDDRGDGDGDRERRRGQRAYATPPRTRALDPAPFASASYSYASAYYPTPTPTSAERAAAAAALARGAVALGGAAFDAVGAALELGADELAWMMDANDDDDEGLFATTWGDADADLAGAIRAFASSEAAASRASPPPPPPPPPRPSGAPREDFRAAGPYEVDSHDVAFYDDGDGGGAWPRRVRALAFKPVASIDARPGSHRGPFPVVAFAIGWNNWASRYARTLAHLASHGFVVLAPTTADRDVRPGRRVRIHTGPRTTPFAWWTPFLKDFLSRRASLSAHHPSVLIPRHAPRRLSTPTLLTPFNSTPTPIDSASKFLLARVGPPRVPRVGAARDRPSVVAAVRSRRSRTVWAVRALQRRGRGGARDDGRQERRRRRRGARDAPQARSMSHWSPYDRVGAVNAVP